MSGFRPHGCSGTADTCTGPRHSPTMVGETCSCPCHLPAYSISTDDFATAAAALAAALKTQNPSVGAVRLVCPSGAIVSVCFTKGGPVTAGERFNPVLRERLSEPIDLTGTAGEVADRVSARVVLRIAAHHDLDGEDWNSHDATRPEIDAMACEIAALRAAYETLREKADAVCDHLEAVGVGDDEIGPGTIDLTLVEALRIETKRDIQARRGILGGAS